MGDRCWFYVRETALATKTRRLIGAERISSGDVITRVTKLFQQFGLTALFIDERPLVNEARTLALILNGLHQITQWPAVPEKKQEAYLALPGGLAWDGRAGRWLNLRCAIVRFSRSKLGAGVVQSFAEFEEGGQTKFVPLIECNRFESIDRVVREFLTPTENVVEIVNGEVRSNPAMLLPRKNPATPVVDQVSAHIVSGSEREKEEDGSLGDYVDQCENHFLLADAYSALAELIAETRLPANTITDVTGIRFGTNAGERLGSFVPRLLGRLRNRGGRR